MMPEELTSDHPQRSGADILLTLVEKAREGDRKAFDKIVELFQDKVFRMVYYRTGSRMDSEDLLQDIFLQAYNSLPKLKEHDKFEPWLFRITLNRIRDFYRKKRVLRFLRISGEDDTDNRINAEKDDAPGALDHVLRQEFWGQVRRFSEKFSRREREVFFLRFLDHLSIKEIATVLGKSESAIKTHLYRSLNKFKGDKELQTFLEGET
ncbi:MAG: RNA polymerase sigma factor [Desulfoferrobacter sp.]